MSVLSVDKATGKVKRLKVDNLKHPMRISFSPRTPNTPDLECVGWDPELGKWSTKGLRKGTDVSDHFECEVTSTKLTRFRAFPARLVQAVKSVFVCSNFD